MLGVFRKILLFRLSTLPPTLKKQAAHRQEAEGQSSRSGWSSIKKQDGYQRDDVSSMTIRRIERGEMAYLCPRNGVLSFVVMNL